MRFSLPTAITLCSLALSSTHVQASPAPVIRAVSPTAASPAALLCTDFKAACVTQCGAKAPTSKCTEGINGALPTLQCRCGTGWFADKTAEVTIRTAIAYATKLINAALNPVQVQGPRFANPSFEDGTLNSWIQIHPVVECSVATDTTSTHGKVALCTSSNGQDVGLGYVIKNVVPDKNYVIKFWLKRVPPKSGDDGTLLRPTYGVTSGEVIMTDEASGLGPSKSSWTQISYPFTAYENEASFMIRFSAPGSSTLSAYFDDFSVTAA